MIGSIVVGSMMPVCGVLLSKLLSYMTAPFDLLKLMAFSEGFEFTSKDKAGYELLEHYIKLYSGLMGVIALLCGIFSVTQKASFGYLGENTTFKIRQDLYMLIIRKNIGWFDDKENGVSVLTSAMAQDTSIINGVSTESLGPQLEGSFALIIGLIIGFIACW